MEISGEKNRKLHEPVMLSEVMGMIPIFQNRKNVIVDATLGLGGHANAILEKLNPGDIFVGIDRDGENGERARNLLENSERKNINTYFIHTNFSHIDAIFEKIGATRATAFLYDLGVSSVHFDSGERGFSIRESGPLDMRFDRTEGMTAGEIVNQWTEKELMRIFREFGEEPKAYFIAQAICESQKKGISIQSTRQLLDLIRASSYDPKSPIRIFQALRIAVNEEFEHIQTSLVSAVNRLEIGGRIIVITFHSLEDRLVKRIFTEFEKPAIDERTGQIQKNGIVKKVTKKPLTPTEKEIMGNPRSRSAKMRVIERVNYENNTFLLQKEAFDQYANSG